MNISDLAKIIDSKPAGSFFRIKYRTKAPVTAEYKATHPEPVYKTVEATVRTGINYYHIGSVIADSDRPKKKQANNYHALIEDRIYYNTNTGKYYVYVYPTENDAYKAEYDKSVASTDLKHSLSKPPVKKILAENVIAVY